MDTGHTCGAIHMHRQSIHSHKNILKQKRSVSYYSWVEIVFSVPLKYKITEVHTTVITLLSDVRLVMTYPRASATPGTRGYLIPVSPLLSAQCFRCGLEESDLRNILSAGGFVKARQSSHTGLLRPRIVL